jgi:mannose-1-phosphate guanylyltransferase / mannose-6-phosphate isomerase
MTKLVYPVILSGGSGTRLWPLSRRAYPKHLLPLSGGKALLQETAARIDDQAAFAPPLILCNEDHRFIIAEQLRAVGIQPTAIVLEPVARNTAPALTAAALIVAERDPNGVMLALPSDHVIRDLEIFQGAVRTASRAAELGLLTTFGIIPEHAETGFGYLKRGSAVAEAPGAYHLSEFVEKPDQNRAESYLASGDYSWNSGMFVLPVRPFLEEVERLEPELFESVRKAVTSAERDLNFTRLDSEAFSAAPSISIDHAVMEHTDLAAVVPVEFGWNDIGSWAALWDIGDRDERGNVTSGDVILHDVANCYVRSEKRLVAGVGVRDLVIVETDDAVLVIERDRAQDAKEIVLTLDRHGRSEAEVHPRVFQAWGDHEEVASGNHFQITLITVNPGKEISFEMHDHGSLHWIVVEGTARVRKGDEAVHLTEDRSIDIPIGVAHGIENTGDVALRLIEVRSGSDLGREPLRKSDLEHRDRNLDERSPSLGGPNSTNPGSSGNPVPESSKDDA